MNASESERLPAETSEVETRLRGEVDRLNRKVSFYVDLLNRTAQERDEARGWSDRRGMVTGHGSMPGRLYAPWKQEETRAGSDLLSEWTAQHGDPLTPEES
jgi:hypothetical protein